MNTAQQTARVGLFFLLGIALVWVTFETLSSGSFFPKKSYTLIAGFADLEELKAGDDIIFRINGVETPHLGIPVAFSTLATVPASCRSRSRSTPAMAASPFRAP